MAAACRACKANLDAVTASSRCEKVLKEVDNPYLEASILQEIELLMIMRYTVDLCWDHTAS